MKPWLLTLLWLSLCSVWTQAQPTVTIVATDDRAAETWPGQDPDTGAVRITRSGILTTALTVNVRLRGDATPGEDYTVAPTFGSSVTFPAGQATLDFTVVPTDDLKPELSKFIRVEVQNPTINNAYLIGGSGRAEITLEDNDDPLTPPQAVVKVSALNPTAAESIDGHPVASTFRFSREKNLAVALTLAYEVTGSATPDEDYSPLSGTVFIPSDQAYVDVTLTPLDDSALEGNETIAVRILPSSCPGVFPPPPDCYLLGASDRAEVTLLEDEVPPSPPVLVLKVAQDPQVYGLPASLNGSITASATNGYITSYEIRLDGSVIVAGLTNQSAAPTSGTPFQFSFSLTNVTRGSHSLQAVVTDQQGLSTTAIKTLFVEAIPRPLIPATYELLALDGEAAETAPGEEPNPATFRVVRRGDPGDFEFFSYKFGGTARQGLDYTVTYVNAVFSTNGFTNIMTQEITVRPVDNDFIESTETVTLELCFPIMRFVEGVGAPIGTYCTGDAPNGLATIQILDNDTTPPPFAVVSVAVTDADAQEVSPLSGLPANPGVFTFVRSGPATNDLVVNYALSRPGTGTSMAENGLDYETLSGVLLIPNGMATADVVLKPVFDTWVEGNETITLTLLPATNSPTRYLLDPSASNSVTMTLRDYAPTNLPILTVVATDAQAVEENVYSRTGTFVVARTGSQSTDLVASYALDGSASNGADYVTLPGTLTIPAGTPSALVIVNPIADGIAEPIETVGLTLRPASVESYPPAYLLNAKGAGRSMAGLTLRDQLLDPAHPYLTKRQRLLLRRFPHRHVVVPLPAPVFNDPSVPPPTNSVATTWAVEASSDLVTWSDLGVATDPEEFVDVTAGDAPVRFYRFHAVAP